MSKETPVKGVEGCKFESIFEFVNFLMMMMMMLMIMMLMMMLLLLLLMMINRMSERTMEPGNDGTRERWNEIMME